MPKSASKLNRIWMGCLWVMVVSVAEVMMIWWMLLLMVFLTPDLIGHLDVGGHCNNTQ
jgi:hypothetical protein